jgi:AAA15 family ATPase/GTPase
MLTRLKIANFRSIQDAEIEVAPITLVYGPNGAGKSSLLYALLVLKHVSLNPNQALDAFFNLAFVNLGGFRQVVFDHRKEATISLGLV